MNEKKDKKESLSVQDVMYIKQMLVSAEKSINSVKKIIDNIGSQVKLSKSDAKKLSEQARGLSVIQEGKIIEGVFDGQNMIGPDEKQYPVPPNYASKSKLVEGDILKLTIGDDGSFIFKQIGPVERVKLIGFMTKEDDECYVIVGDRKFRVLVASVTYFKVEVGDEVTIIVPKDEKSTWAAIENVIKKSSTDDQEDEMEEDDESKSIDENKEDDELEKI